MLNDKIMALAAALQDGDREAVVEAYADLAPSDRTGPIADAALPLVEEAVLEAAVRAAGAEAVRLGLPVRPIGKDRATGEPKGHGYYVAGGCPSAAYASVTIRR